MYRWVSFEGVISFRFGKFVLHDISMAQGSLEVAKEVTLTDVNKMDWYQSAIQNITEKTWLFYIRAIWYEQTKSIVQDEIAQYNHTYIHDICIYINGSTMLSCWETVT